MAEAPDDEPFILDEAVPEPEVETVADGDDGLPHQARLRADGSVELPLRYPVTLRYRDGANGDVREEVHERLVFGRLTGADMRAISAADGAARVVVAIARAARVREGLMHRLYDRMDGADVAAAGAVVAYFLGSGQTTGR